MPNEKPSLGQELEAFIRDIDSLAETLPLTMVVLQEVSKDVRARLKTFEDAHCSVTESDGQRKVTVPLEYAAEYRRRYQRFEKNDLARVLVPRSLFVALVSQYDAFLGRLLRALFLLRPELLRASEKTLTFGELMSFPSVEAARDHLLEKEVEAILRESHLEQIKWLESRFEITLRKGLSILPQFIELTERRNLFVHTDGAVSTQYLATCSQNGVSHTEEARAGATLSVPQDYFLASYRCIFEMGAKLTHVLWRKLLPDDRKAADASLIESTYDLLVRREYSLARALLDFACETLKKHADEWHHLVFVVNRAQAYKWGGDAPRAKEIMQRVDWSAKSDDFRLAAHVLDEDWAKAVESMKRIGPEGVVTKAYYRDWPLFRDFRKQASFLETYETVFGEPFPASVQVSPAQSPAPTLPGSVEPSTDEGADVEDGEAAAEQADA